MTTLDEVLEFRRSMYEKSVALVSRKGHDYNNQQQAAGDTLFNLRVCALLGVVDSLEAGILVRLCDKFMRLVSLTKPGVEAAVTNESVLDTVLDAHNYLDYLALEWSKRQTGWKSTSASNTIPGTNTVDTINVSDIVTTVINGNTIDEWWLKQEGKNDNQGAAEPISVSGITRGNNVN